MAHRQPSLTVPDFSKTNATRAPENTGDEFVRPESPRGTLSFASDPSFPRADAEDPAPDPAPESSEPLESAPARGARPKTSKQPPPAEIVSLPKTISEEDLWKYFNHHRHTCCGTDVWLHARWRRDAMRQFATNRHGWLVELWQNSALRCLVGRPKLLSAAAVEMMNKPGARVLEIAGFCTNLGSWLLAEEWPDAEVFNFRFSSWWPEVIAKGAHGTGPSNFQPSLGDSVTDMPFPSNFFDVICSQSLIYMVPAKDVTAAIEELLRVLKPGGRLEIFASSVTTFQIPDRVGYTRKLSSRLPDDVEATWIQALADSGFTNIQTSYLALPYQWGGEIGYMSELMVLYNRLRAVHLLQQLGSYVDEHTVDLAMHLPKHRGMVTTPAKLVLTMAVKHPHDHRGHRHSAV